MPIIPVERSDLRALLACARYRLNTLLPGVPASPAEHQVEDILARYKLADVPTPEPGHGALTAAGGLAEDVVVLELGSVRISAKKARLGHPVDPEDVLVAAFIDGEWRPIDFLQKAIVTVVAGQQATVQLTKVVVGTDQPNSLAS